MRIMEERGELKWIINLPITTKIKKPSIIGPTEYPCSRLYENKKKNN